MFPVGAKITVLNDSPNSVNINVSAAPRPWPTGDRKQAPNWALRGDADRLIAVDEKGEVVTDLLMLILSTCREEDADGQHLCNHGDEQRRLDVAAQENGLNVIRISVGDRYVLEKMLEGGYRLGGEQQAPDIFRFSTTGDGLLSAIKLAKCSGRRAAPLLLPLLDDQLPQVTVNCRVSRKGWEENPAFQEALQNVRNRSALTGGCWSALRDRPLMRYGGRAGERRPALLASELASILLKS